VDIGTHDKRFEEVSMRPLLCAALAALFALAPAAHAGPLDVSKAKAHLAAIAAGKIDAVMQDYADDAYMDWVGGALEGRYRGKAAIRAVWEKFFAANRGKPRPMKSGEVESYSSPSGTSLDVTVEYGGAVPVTAWQVFVYRDGDLTTEIWQNVPPRKGAR
jgi:hypothetical protein